jgi:hypothetical protein
VPNLVGSVVGLACCRYLCELKGCREPDVVVAAMSTKFVVAATSTKFDANAAQLADAGW